MFLILCIFTIHLGIHFFLPGSGFAGHLKSVAQSLSLVFDKFSSITFCWPIILILIFSDSSGMYVRTSPCICISYNLFCVSYNFVSLCFVRAVVFWPISPSMDSSLKYAESDIKPIQWVLQLDCYIFFSSIIFIWYCFVWFQFSVKKKSILFLIFLYLLNIVILKSVSGTAPHILQSQAL